MGASAPIRRYGVRRVAMAAESSNGPACTAVRPAIVDRIGVSGLNGGPHRCRRPRHGASRLIRDGRLDRRHAGSPLGPRSESLSTLLGRRAGSRSGERWIRSTPRCPVTDIHLHVATVESASTVVATSSLGRADRIRLRNGESGAVGPDRNARLRGVHAAGTGSNDEPHLVRSGAHHRRRFMPSQRSRRLVSAAPGSPNGRSRCGSRSWACQPGEIRAAAGCRRARLDGTDRPRPRSQSDRSRVRTALVQHRPLPLIPPVGQSEGR